MSSSQAVLLSENEAACFAPRNASTLRSKPAVHRRTAAGLRKKPVLFETVAGRGSHVYVAGTFNGWDPASQPLEYSPEDGVFRKKLFLPPGFYEYKFVIDGIWHIDGSCPNWVLNNSGGLNSVLTV